MSDPIQQDSDVKSGGDPQPKPSSDDPLSVLSPEARKIFEETQGNLLSALQKEREANEQAQKRATALEKAAQDAEKNRLKDKEDYRKLYETAEGELAELKPKAERLTAYETILKKMLETSIAEIPEDKRGLVPSKLSIEDQLEWISANRALLGKAQPFDIGAGKQGGGKTKSVDLSPEELQIAKDYGMTAEEYAKYKDQPV